MPSAADVPTTAQKTKEEEAAEVAAAASAGGGAKEGKSGGAKDELLRAALGVASAVDEAEALLGLEPRHGVVAHDVTLTEGRAMNVGELPDM